MIDVLVIGGGAAGFFGAITAAENGARVVLLEATAHLLAKVRVSGGGRCNVTHACFDPKELVRAYPRGGRELLGAFHRWQPRDMVAWLETRGVATKTEEDGRMFPVTDQSATIIDCLKRAADAAGVDVRLQQPVTAVSFDESADQFQVHLRGGTRPAAPAAVAAENSDAILHARRVLIATGGGRASAGFAIAESFGHTIEPLVPSLFTFHLDDPRLKGLEGLSVPHAAARSDQARLVTAGPALVTHWGLSGPAILKLSAWSAREFAACDYRFKLQLSWIGAVPVPAARAALVAARTGAHARQKVANWNPWALPARLWERIAATAGADESAIWASAANALLDRLAEESAAATFAVTGKSLNKEEFVTCGGVRLAEVDFRTLESKRRPGLHFAGEVLDIDGVTGGFNFQAAWTTARLAGLAMRPPSL